MDTSPDKVKIFLRMHQELKEYNEAYSDENPPEPPKYDPELFREFRDWQEDRLAERP